MKRNQRQQNSEIIASTSSNIDRIEIISGAIIDEISTNPLSVAGLEETQNLFVEKCFI